MPQSAQSSTVMTMLSRATFDLMNVARAFMGMDTLDYAEQMAASNKRAMSLDDIWVAAWYEFCMEDQMDSIMNIYMEGADTFAVAVGQGRLYKIPVTVNGSDITFQTPQEVVQQFTPAARSRMMIFRQADGRVRWTALASTATLNRDGMIDGVALFDSMAAYDYTDIGKPYLTYWHNGKALRMGQADMLWRDGHCYFNSGLFDEDFPYTEEVAHTLETDGDHWGISIGFMATQEPTLVEFGGIPIPVFQAGYQVELSILPEKRAASNLTRINVERGKTMTMSAAMRAEARRLIGDEEKADAFIKGVEHEAEDTEKIIQEKKMITRETTAAADTTQTDEAKPAAAAETEAVIELTDELVSQIATTVLQSQQFIDLDHRVQELEGTTAEMRNNKAVLDAIAELRNSMETRIAKLERSDTDKVSEAVADAPARSKVRLSYRASEQRDADDAKRVVVGGTLFEGTSRPVSGIRQDVV